MPQLTPAQIETFEREGYLVVPGLLDPEHDLDPVIREYEGVLDRLAVELQEAGQISSAHADLGFSDRLVTICQETGRIHHQSFDFSYPQQNLQADTPIWTGPAIFDILRNETILDTIESLIGPEIYSNPVQHVRLKLPESRAVRDANGEIIHGATQWHQDNGVIMPEADETEMVTVWLPLWDAPEESGCLQVVPRSHTAGVVDHCPMGAKGVGIPDHAVDLDRAVALPMQRGDVLFLHRRTSHASLANHSERIRWSFDLRYHPIGQNTGRASFPGFVARSRAHPETELHDAQAWAQSWADAKERIVSAPAAPVYNRWDGSAEVCA
jgi:hypothetical protein